MLKEKVGCVGEGGRGGYEQRIEVTVKMQNEKKKIRVGSSLRGGGGGIEELKLL